MIVEKILKQLTPERVEKEIKAIQKIKLPPELQKWVDEYEKIGGRDGFIWKWLYKMFQIVQIPVIAQKYKKNLLITKILMTMFIVQLDDIADKEQNKNLLNELLKIPLNNNYIKTNYLTAKEKRYLFFTKKVWNDIEKRIKKYPKYKELKEILDYDINQVLNAIKYSYLVNKTPSLINKTEYWLYLPYNMVLFIYSAFDLMCSHHFKLKEIGKIREIIWRAQRMARIGNWITTWQREIKENDFSSGVFAYAMDVGAITSKDLKKENSINLTKTIKKMKLEKALLKEWERYYNEISKISKRTGIINIKDYLARLEKLIILHLISNGHK